jgi:hypothetical protein
VANDIGEGKHEVVSLALWKNLRKESIENHPVPGAQSPNFIRDIHLFQNLLCKGIKSSLSSRSKTFKAEFRFQRKLKNGLWDDCLNFTSLFCKIAASMSALLVRSVI